MTEVVQGPSKQILVALGVRYMEDNCCETWGDKCPSCKMIYWHILHKLFGVITNCLISNKIKDYNSQISFRADHSRKIKKFKKN